MRNLVAGGIILGLSVSTAAAQSTSNAVSREPSNASPAEVARNFFAAERDARWIDAARLLDLNTFEVQRTQDVATARRARPQFHLTVEELLRHDPGMPRAVAEYQVKQADAASRDYNPFSYEYADVTSADSLAALPIEVAAARWLEAKDPRWLMKQHLHESVASCSPPPEADSMFKPGVPRVVGIAPSISSTRGSPDSVSYVLFRGVLPVVFAQATNDLRMARAEMHFSPGVLTLIRTSGGWRIVPVTDFGAFGGLSNGFSFICSVDSIKPRSK